MSGKACIRAMRVAVGVNVGQIGAGRSADRLVAEHPYLAEGRYKTLPMCLERTLDFMVVREGLEPSTSAL
jgi:hypothetical protein